MFQSLYELKPTYLYNFHCSRDTCWNLNKFTCPSPRIGKKTELPVPWCQTRPDSEISRKSLIVYIYGSYYFIYVRLQSLMVISKFEVLHISIITCHVEVQYCQNYFVMSHYWWHRYFKVPLHFKYITSIQTHLQIECIFMERRGKLMLLHRWVGVSEGGCRGSNF